MVIWDKMEFLLVFSYRQSVLLHVLALIDPLQRFEALFSQWPWLAWLGHESTETAGIWHQSMANKKKQGQKACCNHHHWLEWERSAVFCMYCQSFQCSTADWEGFFLKRQGSQRSSGQTRFWCRWVLIRPPRFRQRLLWEPPLWSSTFMQQVNRRNRCVNIAFLAFEKQKIGRTK